MLKIRTDGGFTLPEMMMQSAGSWYFGAEGNLDIVDNSVLREAIDLYLEMYEKGIIYGSDRRRTVHRFLRFMMSQQ